MVTQHAQFIVIAQRDFKNLVNQVTIGRQFFKSSLKKLELHVEIHPLTRCIEGSVDEDLITKLDLLSKR